MVELGRSCVVDLWRVVVVRGVVVVNDFSVVLLFRICGFLVSCCGAGRILLRSVKGSSGGSISRSTV